MVKSTFLKFISPVQQCSKGSLVGSELMVGARRWVPSQELPAAGLGTKPGGKSSHTPPGHTAPEPRRN